MALKQDPSMMETTLYVGHPAMFRSRPVSFILCVLLIPVVIGAVILLVWWLQSLSTTLLVTDRRVNLQKGLLSKHTNDIFHNDIRNVRMDRSFFQRMMGTGDLGISSAGQSGIEIEVSGIPDPEYVKSVIDRYR